MHCSSLTKYNTETEFGDKEEEEGVLWHCWAKEAVAG